MAEPIILVEYDPGWLAAYQRQKALVLEGAMQIGCVHRTHWQHPGAWIDIMVGQPGS